MFSVSAMDNVISITTQEETVIPGLYLQRERNGSGESVRRIYEASKGNARIFDRKWNESKEHGLTYGTKYFLVDGKAYVTLDDGSINEIADVPSWITNPTGLEQMINDICAELKGSVIRYVEDYGTLIITEDRFVIPIGCEEVIGVVEEAKIFNDDGIMLDGPYNIEALKGYESFVISLHKQLCS